VLPPSQQNESDNGDLCLHVKFNLSKKFIRKFLHQDFDLGSDPEPNRQQHLKVHGHQKLAYHFPKSAQFSENFDTNIGTQRFVNTKKTYI